MFTSLTKSLFNNELLYSTKQTVINGATQIIGNVPGQYLNPLLVAESQTEAHSGYIVVIYNIEPKQYDLLFLQGRAITHCARMNKDLRFFIDQHVVTSTFREHHKESLISLFTCDDESIRRFVATFHSEPCLKVHVDALSKPQILALVKSTGCTQGIIERNDFSAQLPTIELKEIVSSTQLPQFKAGFSRGRLLVYDILKNQEIQSQRFAGQPLLFAATTSKRKRRTSKTVDSANNDNAPHNLIDADMTAHQEPAEALESLVKEILGTDQLPVEHSPLTIENSNPVPRPQPVPTKSGSSVDISDSTSSLTLASSTNKSERHDPPEPQSQETPELQSSVEAALQIEETKQTDQTAFTRALERLVRSFRQQVVELCPQRAESIFAQAQKKALMLNPDFNVRSLNDETAIIVLDLIEEMVRNAPLLKRSKCRETASELVSDLYNKHYELLEQHKSIDAVEQCYYRLKGSKG